jgi:hypothetical protein
MKRLVFVLVVLVLTCVVAADEPTFQIPEGLPLLNVPVLVTTCGQSPGALMVTLICLDVGIQATEADLITAEELAAQCSDPTPYGVLFITTGTSLKGMGGAGVDVDSEVARCLALIEKAKELGLFVIVGQVEGPSRRADEMDEKAIRSMSPLANLLITHSSIDTDGYFTQVAADNNIPQIFIVDTIDLKVLLPLLFAK